MVPPAVGLFVLLIVVIVLVRLWAGSMDDTRLRDEVAKDGGTVEEVHWQPFGKGWFGEKGDRIYDVRYRDREGQLRRATFKTSAFSGVYRTDDHEVSSVYPQERAADDPAALRAEVARLRKELDEERSRTR